MLQLESSQNTWDWYSFWQGQSYKCIYIYIHRGICVYKYACMSIHIYIKKKYMRYTGKSLRMKTETKCFTHFYKAFSLSQQIILNNVLAMIYQSLKMKSKIGKLKFDLHVFETLGSMNGKISLSIFMICRPSFYLADFYFSPNLNCICFLRRWGTRQHYCKSLFI